jgi:hypothetical protein
MREGDGGYLGNRQKECSDPTYIVIKKRVVRALDRIVLGIQGTVRERLQNLCTCRHLFDMRKWYRHVNYKSINFFTVRAM